ncbi:uncharacterized protein LOC135395158 [Ornithodoros turicata]|uniref:uncharacterized protein LOC135395158 n=1 Tax=Ornithodoros turicata TaxID=34597 RepID=UPI003138F06A
MRMLPALAFLLPAEVRDAFHELLEVFPSEATDLAMYFEDTYVGRRRRNGVQTAMFPSSLWSVHDAVQQDMPRTNNSVEAWHRGFQSNVDCCLPNLWAFLRCLKDEQALQEMKMAQLDAGQQRPRLARKYKNVNECISRVLEEHSSGSPLCTLQNIARNIRFCSRCDLCHVQNDYATSLLSHFVDMFAELYGEHFVSYNVHGLLHLADDVKVRGPVDTFSAFPYENYMQTLK